MKASVIRSAGLWYKVKTGEDILLNARLKGTLRQEESLLSSPVVVGDEVRVEPETDGTVSITEIFPRRNYIIRRGKKHGRELHILAANIDQVILLVTLQHPHTPPGFTDRVLAAAGAQEIPVVICFNKTDLLPPVKKEKQEHEISLYRSLGFSCLKISAVDPACREILIPVLKDKTSLLTGLSGSGKSTLINLLDEQLNLLTREISRLTEKGKHTTSVIEKYTLPFGGGIIDAPGIKELGLVELSEAGLSHYFPEMKPLLPQCRFNNCTHSHEPDCAVKAALEAGKINPQRYRSYQSMLEEMKE